MSKAPRPAKPGHHLLEPGEDAQVDFGENVVIMKGHLVTVQVFVGMAKNGYAVLIGNMGTSKTHTAVALGVLACHLGKKVRLYTATALANELLEAQDQHALGKRLAQLARLDLLIVDEVGFVPFTPEGARLLFQAFSERYFKGSLLITSNLEFSRCLEAFGDERLTARFSTACPISATSWNPIGAATASRKACGKGKKCAESQPLKGLVHSLHIKRVWVILAAHPLQQHVVVFVIWVRESNQ